MIFNVQNINYVITGNSEKMINIDILSTNAELQTQSACMTFVTDEGLDSIVNSPLSSVSAKEALSAEYRTHRLKRLDETANSIISVPDNANTTYALFDVKDVAVKCLTIMNPSKNDPEDERNCKIIYSNELKNIFNAHMAENPVGFCQMNDAAIGLAVEGIRFPAMLKTNLLDTREDRLENDQNSMEWFFKVQSEKNDTYTYIPLSNLTLNHRSEDPISTWIDPQGYYFVAKSYKSLSNDVLDDFFINRFDHLSVETNQILKIFTEPLDENRSKYNDFNNGIVRGKTIIGKNAYDAEYSMNMDSVEDLKHARQYIGIGNVGNKIFLKYYDETNYVGDSSLSSLSTTLSSDELKTINSKTVHPSQNSYQNVEIMDKFVGFSGNSANHKSNLYSIWIRNTGLNVNNDDLISKYKDKIRSEVANSVRIIAESLAPAHTQLFKVFFDK